jgi:FAT domain
MGETEKDGDRFQVGRDSSSEISKHQGYDMYYSVIWNTQDRTGSGGKFVDLSTREELWLAKLGAWTEALAVYEDKLKRDPNDFDAMVGCMRCLVANGEWQKVLELNDWATVSGPSQLGNTEGSGVSQRKALRMCAQSAWRLGQWDELEKFASDLVGSDEKATTSPLTSGDHAYALVDFDGAFYSAVLHVHRKEWTDAANSIDAARQAMDGRLTALMAESYSRAYPSMITAQTLAEMEEIVEYRKTEERATASSQKHQVNRPNPTQARTELLSVWRKRLAGCRVDAEVHASILAVRSLILGPSEEVESILALSELSRQSKRYKFAERVLLEPLEALNADLNGPSFGFHVSEQLGMRVDFSGYPGHSFPLIIDRIVATDLATIVPAYGPKHDQWSTSLVKEAGGLDR